MDNEEIKVQEPQGSASDILVLIKRATRWKTYVIYALLAVVAVEAVVIVWQRGNVAKAELAVEDKNRRLVQVILSRDLAIANEASCRINLDDQSGKIKDAGKRYERLQKEMLDLAKRIAAMDVYKPADDARDQPTPKSCQEALDFMNRNFP